VGVGRYKLPGTAVRKAARGQTMLSRSVGSGERTR